MQVPLRQVNCQRHRGPAAAHQGRTRPRLAVGGQLGAPAPEPRPHFFDARDALSQPGELSLSRGSSLTWPPPGRCRQSSGKLRSVLRLAVRAAAALRLWHPGAARTAPAGPAARLRGPQAGPHPGPRRHGVGRHSRPAVASQEPDVDQDHRIGTDPDLTSQPRASNRSPGQASASATAGSDGSAIGAGGIELAQFEWVKDEVDVNDLRVTDCEAERSAWCCGSDRPDGARRVSHECG